MTVAQARIEVIVTTLEAEEPRLMVDASGEEGDLVVGDVELAGEHAGGALHTVAETDDLDAESIEEPAAHGHRIGVVDEQGVRAELVHVGGDLAVGGGRAEKAEDTAGAERIANGLVEAIAAGDLDVEAVGVEAADLEGDDHVGGAVEGAAAVGGGFDTCREAVVGDELASGGGRALQPVGIDVHEGECAVAQLGKAEQVADQAKREDVAAGTDDRDLGHCVSLLESGMDDRTATG